MTSTSIARPTFYEGEILPAADLTAGVDYSRNQMARHSRYLHSWGIATGLQLSFTNGTATLGQGVAIDGTGREIVVPADVQLDSNTFTVFQTADAWYPVYLNGVDTPAAASSNLTGACGGAQSTSMQETYQITFGTPGSEQQVAQQATVAVTAGPDGGTTGVWLILVGFVQSTGSSFSAAQTTSQNSAVVPQYVGVNAARVVSGSGSLLLATDPAAAAPAKSVMAVQIQENPAQLVFGKLGANGKVTPAFTVKANGDVTTTGQVSATSIPVAVQVQSGIAFDGMILPVPLGLNSNNTQFYVQVSPRIDPNLPPPAFGAGAIPLAIPLECTVNPATRRVSCRVQWFDATNMANGPTIAPAPCDYLIIAASGAS
jgi:hypothetical protein